MPGDECICVELQTEGFYVTFPAGQVRGAVSLEPIGGDRTQITFPSGMTGPFRLLGAAGGPANASAVDLGAANGLNVTFPTPPPAGLDISAYVAIQLLPTGGFDLSGSLQGASGAVRVECPAGFIVTIPSGMKVLIPVHPSHTVRSTVISGRRWTPDVVVTKDQLETVFPFGGTVLFPENRMTIQTSTGSTTWKMDESIIDLQFKGR